MVIITPIHIQHDIDEDIELGLPPPILGILIADVPVLGAVDVGLRICSFLEYL